MELIVLGGLTVLREVLALVSSLCGYPLCRNFSSRKSSVCSRVSGLDVVRVILLNSPLTIPFLVAIGW